jgi:3-oxoadipate enol-lactonase
MGLAGLVADSFTIATDGTRLGYTLHEGSGHEGSGPGRLVLVHSLAMDRSFWQPVIDALEGAASVVALDCRGHGASGKPPGPYTVELFADDVAQVMTAVNWPTAVVGGASMGGCIALAFAARHPERCAGLGLFDTTAWYGPDAPARWAERADKALSDGLESLVDFQKTRWFGDRFRAEHPKAVAESVAVLLRNDRRAYGEICRMLGACDLRDQLGRLDLPTRIVVGEEDYATPPAMAEALHAAIAGSVLTVIEGGRHLAPLECPTRIAAELKHLLEAKSP